MPLSLIIPCPHIVVKRVFEISFSSVSVENGSKLFKNRFAHTIFVEICEKDAWPSGIRFFFRLLQSVVVNVSVFAKADWSFRYWVAVSLWCALRKQQNTTLFIYCLLHFICLLVDFLPIEIVTGVDHVRPAKVVGSFVPMMLRRVSSYGQHFSRSCAVSH